MMSDNNYSYEDFLAMHKNQLTLSAVPEIYWETLHVKLKEEVFDAGRAFQLVQVQDEDDDFSWMVNVTSNEGVKTGDARHIYLVDHAWTFQQSTVLQQLASVDGLVNRLAFLMDIPVQNGVTSQEIMQQVTNKMWRFSHPYQLGLANQEGISLEPLWYIMDEFGSRIQHSDEPSVRMVPFYYTPTKTAFTLMWTIADMDAEDEVTRDYAEHVSGTDLRRARLTPYFVDDLTEIDPKHTVREEKYFKQFTASEKLPENTQELSKPSFPIKIFTDLADLKETLKGGDFVFVENQKNADVIWLSGVTDYKAMSKNNTEKFINHFPGENLLVFQDPLAVLARSSVSEDGSQKPEWLPVMYNLTCELPQFVACFQKREQDGLDNNWVSTAWTLPVSVDSHLTDNLDQLVRYSLAGERLAMKYPENPVLVNRDGIGEVTFDVQYTVLLNAVEPLTLSVYKPFLARLGGRSFTLERNSDFETHLIGVNLSQDTKVQQLKSEEFVPMFNKQSSVQWKDVETSVFTCIRDMFEAATKNKYPHGLSKSLQSRAAYTAQFSFEWKEAEEGENRVQPLLTSIRSVTDGHEMASKYPRYFKDVFSYLFLKDFQNTSVQVLCAGSLLTYVA